MSDRMIKCIFSKQQYLKQHHHTEYEILYILNGTIELTISESSYLLEAGDFYLINTGCAHSLSAKNSPLVGILQIPFDTLHSYFSTSPVLFSCNSKDMSGDSVLEIQKLLSKVFTYSYLKNDQSKLIYDISCLQLIHLLAKKCLATGSDPIFNIPAKESDKRAFELIKYIDDNYNSDLNLSELARRFHITPQYLSKYFKETFGQTLLSYVQKRRLDHSVYDLINSQKTITEISISNGFPNVNSFINAFKASYNVTPSKYRKNHSANAEPFDGLENTVDIFIDEEGEEVEGQVRKYLQLVDNSDIQNSDRYREELSVSVNLDKYDTALLKKPWQKLLNMGNSANLIRYDVREQMRYCHDDLGFEYVYINNLLHPNMKIRLDEKTGRYNFSEIKKALDYIVSLGMHPYIELESMSSSSPVDTENILISNTKSQLEFLYNNHSLLDAFLTFIINRYGHEEVSTWYFSMEHSSAEDNYVKDEHFFRYFASIYRTIKHRIPGSHIGGPGFTIDFSEKTLSSFISAWINTGCTPDFISLYAFPYVYDMDLVKANKNILSPDSEHLLNLLNHVKRALKTAGLGEKEIHVPLWNSTLSNNNVVNDSCYKAAFITKNMIQTWKDCDFVGYWCASDICISDDEDQPLLYGAGGLLSQNDIRKPAYHAYAFLKELFPYYISGSDHTIVTANDRNHYTICCHNYKHYNAYFYQKSEDRIKIEELPFLFEDSNPLSVRIELKDLPNGEYMIRKKFVNEENGNIQASWLSLKEMPYFDYSKSEINYLRAKSEPGLEFSKITVTDHTLVIDEILMPHEIALLKIEYL